MGGGNYRGPAGLNRVGLSPIPQNLLGATIFFGKNFGSLVEDPEQASLKTNFSFEQKRARRRAETKKRKFSLHSFTIIELITVIAVGAILMAMIIPLATGARKQYAIVQTKAQFHRYTLAMEQFKAEYGQYPQLGSSPIAINATPGRFVELMTGKNLTGGAMDDPIAAAQNPKGIMFLQFAANELMPDGEIQDGFGQTNWQLYIDTDGDGFLNGTTGNPIRASIGWQSSGTSGTFTSW
jgi:type II secretory pathway pseudopilin PulG